MNKFAFTVVVGIALGGCSIEKREYEMTVDQASGKLLASHFEKGILPGSSLSRPIVHRDYDGNLEWMVTSNDDLEHATGWWCPITFEPAGEDGKKIRVVNGCTGMFASKHNRNLDELVDAALTGREPKFDR